MKEGIELSQEIQPGLGVGVAIIHQDKVLFGRRVKNKPAGNFTGLDTLTFPGGKCRKFETLKQNAAREVSEETGLELDESRLELVSVEDLIEEDRDAHYVTIGFIYHYNDDENPIPKVMEPNEIDIWQWFDIKDLPDIEKTYKPTEQIIQDLGWRG
jgi:ADP-ribose pyrophosphatase YjhB (NUDIX family)